MKIRESHNNIVVRGVYGLLFIAAVIGGILCGPYGFGLLLLAIIIGGTIEFYRMTQLQGYRPLRTLGVVCGIALFAINYDNVFLSGDNFGLFEMVFILTIPAMFVWELFTGSKSPMADLGTTLLSLIYIAIPTMLLCNVAMLLGDGQWCGGLMIAYFVIIWANDTFAYIFGITLGAHKMFPRISPKKSWEGFFGGVISSSLVGALLAYQMGQNVAVWCVMAFLSSTTGVLGDLVESMFKRSVDIKDSGQVLPGHGGWLDRFDAIFVSTPVVFVYLYLLELLEII